MSLPKGWIETLLGALCSKPQYGYTTKASDEGDVKFLRTTDVTKPVLNWEKVPYCLVNPSSVDKYLLENGDIVISRAGSVGYSCRLESIPVDTVFASYLIRFKPNKLIDGAFIKHFLNAPEYWQQITDVSAGVAVQNINAKKLEVIKLPLPPLNEQKCIAKKLDELLATVEGIKTRLDNAPTIIKRFRQSILATATSGKLTEEWREENEIKNTWKNVAIGSLFSELQQGWSPKCENNPVFNDEWAVIKTSSVQSVNFVEIENKKLPSTLTPREHLSLKKGDILITRAGPRVRCAVTCYIHKDFDNLMICDKVYRIRVDKDKALAKYLVYVLNAPKHLAELEKMKTGISESGLNLTQKKFKLMLVGAPDLKEQKEIVSQVESLFTLADTLEEKIEAAKKRVDKLTQSILAKAFRGELVPQDPNDESAEKLLERIRAEQDKEKLKKTRKKK